MHAGAKRQMREDRQLLRRVAAIDVERWIGLGIAQSLRFLERIGIRDAFLVHLAEDEIRRAVENAVERHDLVRRQALADVRDDRDAAGDGGLECDRAAQLAGPVEQLRAMLGQKRLVRRDDIFAAFEHPQHDRPLGLEAADELRDDFDFRIVNDLIDLVGQHALRQVAAARLFEIVDDRLFEPQRAAGVASRAVAVLDEQLGDALPTVPRPIMATLVFSIDAISVSRTSYLPPAITRSA